MNETQTGPGAGVRRLQCAPDISDCTGKRRADANCSKIECIFCPYFPLLAITFTNSYR